jgi:hypothetical protein
MKHLTKLMADVNDQFGYSSVLKKAAGNSYEH